ncbi:MAG: SDR family oxidoreductase [Isosphaeraceae bacterium]
MSETKTMNGKTCLVTGATSGIGEVASEELARRGAKVVLVGRDRERCEATARRIQQSTNNPDIDWMLADLSSHAEVRRLAGEIQARCPRLDVLINNAGALYAPRRESVDGIEMTWALNHLGYFLLTTLLLDTLKASAPARIVNVASGAHRMVPGIDFDDPEGKKRYKPFRIYGQSKLANILFTYELARRLEGTGVTANCLHPGFVATSFTNGKGWLYWVMKQASNLMAISPQEGARTTVYLATSPEVEGITGKYFDKCKQAQSSPASLDVAASRRLWQLSEEMTRQRAD